MESVTLKAPAKINWYLNVVKKRDDGYHDIETVMQTIDLYDILTVTRASHKDINITIKNNTYNIDAGENNIIYKAAKQLGVYGVDTNLEKNIPVEAGLGGGSSDAACAMKIFNDIFELGLSKSELAAKAAKIGADVPFFIYGGACAARGIGDIIEPIKPVERYDILIRKPEKGISTALIYNLIDSSPKQDHPSMEDFLKHFNDNDSELINYMFNDMERVSLPLCSQINDAKKSLLNDGCIAAMMSGSGSAVFGLKEKNS